MVKVASVVVVIVVLVEKCVSVVSSSVVSVSDVRMADRLLARSFRHDCLVSSSKSWIQSEVGKY